MSGTEGYSEEDKDYMRKRIPVLCKLAKAQEVTEQNASQIRSWKDCKELYLLQVRIYAYRLGWTEEP